MFYIFVTSNFYIESFKNLGLINKVWDKVLELQYPAFLANLKRLEIDNMLYIPTWFLTRFQTINFPTPFKLHLFDRMLGFGTWALLSFGITIVLLGKDKITTGSMEVVTECFQNPPSHPKFADWRSVIKKWDKKFLSQVQYSAYFKKAQVVEFP
jgi:hypothetical protein